MRAALSGPSTRRTVSTRFDDRIASGTPASAISASIAVTPGNRPIRAASRAARACMWRAMSGSFQRGMPRWGAIARGPCSRSPAPPGAPQPQPVALVRLDAAEAIAIGDAVQDRAEPVEAVGEGAVEIEDDEAKP